MDEKVKKLAQRIASEMNIEGYLYLGEVGSVVFTTRLLAELHKEIGPVVPVEKVLMIFRVMNSRVMTPNTEEGWRAALEPFIINPGVENAG